MSGFGVFKNSVRAFKKRIEENCGTCTLYCLFSMYFIESTRQVMLREAGRFMVRDQYLCIKLTVRAAIEGYGATLQRIFDI